MRRCDVSGCNGRAGTYSRFCNAHKARNRRHGHPGQYGMTKADLKPYLGTVRDRIAKNASNAAWSHFEARWAALVDDCKARLAEHEQGRPYVRHARQAALEIVKIAQDEVQARTVLETVIALYLMADQDERRFRSDRAFLHQVVRRVRALTERNVGQYYDHQAGRRKRVYREFPPQAALVMGQWINEALGVAGLKVAKLERQEAEAKLEERRALSEALADLR